MQVGGGYPRKQLTRRAKKQLSRKKQLTRRATKQLARKKQLTRRAKEQRRKKQLRNQQVRKLRRCQCPMKRLGRMPLQVEAAYCMASIGSLLEHGEHLQVQPIRKSGQTSSS